jgi:hypothetical protein
VNRDEFASLPLRIALGLIYDMARAKLEPLPRLDVPKPPLYDGRLSKGGGFMWMSEMVLADLEWWARAKKKSAESGGTYADKDRKTFETLTKWIAWRTLYPSDTWSGKRGDERVSAAPPSGNPRINEWGPRSDVKKKPAAGGPTQAPRADDDGGADPEGYGF